MQGARPIGARFASRPGKQVCVFTTQSCSLHPPCAAVPAYGAEPVTKPQTTGMVLRGLRRRGASADPLSQGNDDPLWPAHVGHAPDVLVLTDAADQAVAVRNQLVDRRLQIVDFE